MKIVIGTEYKTSKKKLWQNSVFYISMYEVKILLEKSRKKSYSLLYYVTSLTYSCIYIIIY